MLRHILANHPVWRVWAVRVCLSGQRHQGITAMASEAEDRKDIRAGTHTPVSGFPKAVPVPFCPSGSKGSVPCLIRPARGGAPPLRVPPRQKIGLLPAVRGAGADEMTRTSLRPRGGAFTANLRGAQNGT